MAEGGAIWEQSFNVAGAGRRDLRKRPQARLMDSFSQRRNMTGRFLSIITEASIFLNEESCCFGCLHAEILIFGACKLDFAPADFGDVRVRTCLKGPFEALVLVT